ncbi:hypothetical protein [Streptomyces sp. NBC_00280]|uniref:hypothetical protein n=1 Tax=Streptomyces sp. NBC_00280 TaxID=2975699 RepID=UPI0032513744
MTDPDGAKTQARYEITADPAHADTTCSYTGYGTTVASGSTSSRVVPSASAFSAGSHLRYPRPAGNALTAGRVGRLRAPWNAMCGRLSTRSETGR